MNTFKTLVTLLALTFTLSGVTSLSVGLPTAQATPSKAQAVKPIKRLLTSIRYQKDKIALTSFDGQAQGKLIFGEEWGKQPEAERTRFISALHSFFRLIAFPKIRKDFKHLETIMYSEPTPVDDRLVKVRATIVILHTLKKDELPVDFHLIKDQQGKWKITDFWIAPRTSDTPSFLTRLKKQQIDPLFKAEGWAGLLTAMENRITEIEKK